MSGSAVPEEGGRVEAGRAFIKMSGSGNDFLFFDTRDFPAGDLETPERIRALCRRGTGVGADGVVFIERSSRADFGIRYFNADGSLASLCGNASLCSARLGVEMGLAPAAGMTFDTGVGTLAARLRPGTGQAEIDLEPVVEMRPQVEPIGLVFPERRVGYAVAGVPHLVILCDDVDAADVAGRGPGLRSHATLGPAGANVNWVAAGESASGQTPAWRIRTFERGVEGETLACGTGAVAAAAVLAAWGLAPAAGTRLVTRTGRPLSVRFDGTTPAGSVRPSLSGEARIVFRGQLAEV